MGVESLAENARARLQLEEAEKGKKIVK